MLYFRIALLQPVLLAFLATVPLVASDSGIVLFEKEKYEDEEGQVLLGQTEH